MNTFFDGRPRTTTATTTTVILGKDSLEGFQGILWAIVTHSHGFLKGFLRIFMDCLKDSQGFLEILKDFWDF